MKILLTGANGQLGRCLQDIFPQQWQVLALGSAELDISNQSAVTAQVEEFQPAIIINAAAYTAVDKAESEPEQAAAVNTYAPAYLAGAAKKVGAKFVHVSTDYVFEGNGTQPYTESDAVYPLGVYGKTKLAGELLVQSILPEAIIIRTAWVFSEYGNNFVKTMLRLAKDRPELGIVGDQLGCPTYAGDIAKAILATLENSAPGGIYHFCGDEQVSWAEFASAIFEQAEQQGKLAKQPKVNAITTADFPTPAKRPAYSVMSTAKIGEFTAASPWRESLSTVLSRLD